MKKVSLEHRVEAARTALMLKQPFLARAIFELETHIVEWCPTAMTDGMAIYLGRKFFDSLPRQSDIEFILAHESLHCLLLHHVRFKRLNVDHYIANIAADHVINGFLVEAGMSMPEVKVDGKLVINGVKPEARFKDLSFEEVYKILKKESKKNKDESNAWDGTIEGLEKGQDASGSVGLVGLPKNTKDAGSIQAQQDALEAEKFKWEMVLSECITRAKAAGMLPGSLARELQQVKEPEIDWENRLRELVTASFPNDWTWQRPDRNFLHCDLYLPSTDPEKRVGFIVLTADTSGSMGPDELNAIGAALLELVRELRPEGLLVIWCDSKVQGEPQEFDGDGSLVLSDLKPKGGGGTDFRPPFRLLAERGIDPVCLIYATDLCCDSYPSPPDFPVIWLVTQVPSFQPNPPPFGEVIPLPIIGRQ